jgi:hypothetical protein
MNLGRAVREATAGVWQNPWLLLPLAVAFAYGALGWLVGLSAWTFRLGSGLALVGNLLFPAFLAWWVGWAGEAAHGRRLRPADALPTLGRAAGPMYMLLFAYAVVRLLVARVAPPLLLVVTLAPIALNPWIDFAAEGDARVERIQRRLGDPAYWLVALSGLLFVLLWLWTTAGPAAAWAALPGSFPPVSPAAAVAYAAATWLWAVRARVLGDPGVWHSARMRRFLRESRRRWDEEDDG